MEGDDDYCMMEIAGAEAKLGWDPKKAVNNEPIAFDQSCATTMTGPIPDGFEPEFSCGIDWTSDPDNEF